MNVDTVLELFEARNNNPLKLYNSKLWKIIETEIKNNKAYKAGQRGQGTYRGLFTKFSSEIMELLGLNEMDAMFVFDDAIKLYRKDEWSRMSLKDKRNYIWRTTPKNYKTSDVKTYGRSMFWDGTNTKNIDDIDEREIDKKYASVYY